MIVCLFVYMFILQFMSSKLMLKNNIIIIVHFILLSISIMYGIYICKVLFTLIIIIIIIIYNNNDNNNNIHEVKRTSIVNFSTHFVRKFVPRRVQWHIDCSHVAA